MITLEQIRCPNPQCNRRLVDLSGKAEIICPKCKSLIFVDTDERKIYIKPKSVKK
jgi:phage FluMu protein Com